MDFIGPRINPVRWRPSSKFSIILKLPSHIKSVQTGNGSSDFLTTTKPQNLLDRCLKQHPTHISPTIVATFHLHPLPLPLYPFRDRASEKCFGHRCFLNKHEIPHHRILFGNSFALNSQQQMHRRDSNWEKCCSWKNSVYSKAQSHLHPGGDDQPELCIFSILWLSQSSSVSTRLGRN